MQSHNWDWGDHHKSLWKLFQILNSFRLEHIWRLLTARESVDVLTNRLGIYKAYISIQIPTNQKTVVGHTVTYWPIGDKYNGHNTNISTISQWTFSTTLGHNYWAQCPNGSTGYCGHQTYLRWKIIFHCDNKPILDQDWIPSDQNLFIISPSDQACDQSRCSCSVYS